jgi:hypothetical protein
MPTSKLLSVEIFNLIPTRALRWHVPVRDTLRLQKHLLKVAKWTGQSNVGHKTKGRKKRRKKDEKKKRNGKLTAHLESFLASSVIVRLLFARECHVPRCLSFLKETRRSELQ